MNLLWFAAAVTVAIPLTVAADEKSAADQFADAEMKAQRCRPLVAAWDDGNQEPAVAAYGKYAEPAVATCRRIIERAEFLLLNAGKNSK